MLMKELLEDIGLNSSQSDVYIFLLNNGDVNPATIATKLSLTRSNAYKVLDSLADIGLARKTEINKKFVYRAEDPIALSNIVADERNRVNALEQGIREAMQELRRTYEKTSGKTDVVIYQGDAAINSLYLQLAKRGGPTQVMKASGSGTQEKPLARMSEAKYCLLPDDVYTTPVEWIVTSDELVIIDRAKEPTAMRIKSPAIAAAFSELNRIIKSRK